jgi:hypothetical protein
MLFKSKVLALALLALVAVSWAHPGHDKSPAPEWTPQAELKQLFPEANDFAVLRAPKADEFSADVQKKLGKKLTASELSTPMFKARKKDGQVLGYAWVGIVGIEKKASMLLVGSDPQNRVTAVILPENHPGTPKAPFLSQFKGKTANDSFKDIKTENPQQTALTDLVRQATVMLTLASKE